MRRSQKQGSGGRDRFDDRGGRPRFRGKGGGSGGGGRRHEGGRREGGRNDQRNRGPGGHSGEAFSMQGRWVIGVHSCVEVVKVRPRSVAEAVFRPGWQESEAHCEIADVLGGFQVPFREKSPESLERLGSGHQGVALRVTDEPSLDWEKLAQPGHAILLLLDGIEDPHNLGSMLRTAWLTGVSGILIPSDRAVGLTPTVCKIASGGAEHVAVESHTNFGSVIERLKKLGFWVYGLSEKGSAHPWEAKLPEKIVWVVGNEGSGIRVSTERMCDELIRLPQVSSGSSYNASIATAMALSETCRQFGKPE